MITAEKIEQRLFGTESDGVLYLSGRLMKAAKVTPGDKLHIIPTNYGFKVLKANDNPPPGGQL
jgi:hypothetical protein